MKHYFLLKLMPVIQFGVILSWAAWATDFSLSLGGGGLLGYTFTRYTMQGDTKSGGAIYSLQTMDRFDYGGFLFFDATYAEVAVLIRGGSNSYREIMDNKALSSSSWIHLSDRNGSGMEMSFGFSLLGKYPFKVTEQIALFPLLGLAYHIALLEWRRPDGGIVYDRTTGKLPEDRDKDGNSYPLSVWNSLWIDIGAGFDYMFSGHWYLRGEVLFGFRLPTGYENGALEMVKHQFKVPDPKLTGLTGNPTFKIALGYRFFNR